MGLQQEASSREHGHRLRQAVPAPSPKKVCPQRMSQGGPGNCAGPRDPWQATGSRWPMALPERGSTQPRGLHLCSSTAIRRSRSTQFWVRGRRLPASLLGDPRVVSHPGLLLLLCQMPPHLTHAQELWLPNQGRWREAARGCVSTPMAPPADPCWASAQTLGVQCPMSVPGITHLSFKGWPRLYPRIGCFRQLPLA